MTETDAEIERLQSAFKKEVEDINKAALEYQKALRLELDWSMEEQQANIQVCKIRLEHEIERLKRERSGERMNADPFVKLPLEMLGYIFQYHVDDGMPPWGLVKVCKNWMKAAFATPHLWRYLCITDGDRQYPLKWVADGRKHYSRGRMQVCRTVNQLREALQRPGVVPLEIHVEYSGKDASLLPRFLSLLEILINAPISERIGHLDLTALQSSEVVLPIDIQFGHFTRLTSLHLPRQIQLWTHMLLRSIDSTSVQLRMVTLRGPISQDLAVYSFWSRLKGLEIAERGDTDQFNAMVGQLINLQDLSSALYPWPNESTRISTWENIREISLKGNPNHLSRLGIPNVETLTFDDNANQADIADIIPILSYPKLTTLIIHTRDPRWLSSLSAPLLAHLTIQWTGSAVSPPGHDPIRITNNLLSHITSIKLKTPCDDTEVILALENAPNVRKVEVLGRYGGRQLGLQLLQRLNDDEPFVLCPKLESISLGTQSFPIYTLKKNALSLVKRVVTSRKKAGVPLREFLVYWHKNRSLVENYAK